jgi:carbamate kinase
VSQAKRNRVLIAIGGNALYDPKLGNNISLAYAQTICRLLVEVIQKGFQPILTFGNGPQVGNLLDMAETSARLFSDPVTLDTCGAWSQGEIGYWLARELTTALLKVGVQRSIVSIITTTQVDPNDPAFLHPTKPVGRFISPEEAQQLYEERGWIIGPDANRGYRRMVPSPRPIRIVEAEAIATLVDAGVIPLCCGGGGIPVQINDAEMRGIEAVIDKDFTSCLLAKTLQLEALLICTAVPEVYLHYGTPEQTALKHITVAEAEQYLAEGHFPAGSMGPKITAMVDYIRHGGKRAIMTNLDNVVNALMGTAGTELVP